MMSKQEPIAIKLPFPPTMNTTWRNFHGRTILSAKGRTFRADAIAAIWQQLGKPKKLTGRLSVEIVLCRGDKRSYDLDNFPKPILDALKHAGVIGDDKQIDALHVRRGAIIPKPGVACVYIEEGT